MSEFQFRGKVCDFKFAWKKPPHGAQGTTHVSVGKELLEVSWRKDAQGIWIELPHGVFGYDIVGRESDENVGSLEYSVCRRDSSSHAENWSGLSFIREGEENAVAGAGACTKKGLRVRAQMPGKILRVEVKVGETITKDQPLLVMEAMKMENVIRANQAGRVGSIKVTVGQAVETGADLCVLEPV